MEIFDTQIQANLAKKATVYHLPTYYLVVGCMHIAWGTTHLYCLLCCVLSVAIYVCYVLLCCSVALHIAGHILDKKKAATPHAYILGWTSRLPLYLLSIMRPAVYWTFCHPNIQ